MVKELISSKAEFFNHINEYIDEAPRWLVFPVMFSSIGLNLSELKKISKTLFKKDLKKTKSLDNIGRLYFKLFVLSLPLEKSFANKLKDFARNKFSCS